MGNRCWVMGAREPSTPITHHPAPITSSGREPERAHAQNVVGYVLQSFEVPVERGEVGRLPEIDERSVVDDDLLDLRVERLPLVRFIARGGLRHQLVDL